MQTVQEVLSTASPTMSLNAFFAPSIPDRLNGFNVCKQYSGSTNLSLRQKSLTSAARREIVQQKVASQIINICRYPMKDQLNVVGYKVMVSTGIKDKIGIGYVSAKIL